MRLEIPDASDLRRDITQTAHGLSVGDVVRLDGTDYAKAQADSEANAEAVGIVIAVANSNNFTVQTGGFVSGLSSLAAGTVYYLDDDTAGLLTATEPTDTGDVSKPLLIAATTTSGWLFDMRGALISASNSVFLYGVGPPGDVGAVGSIYLDTASGAFYGPRADSVDTFGLLTDASAQGDVTNNYEQATKYTMPDTGSVTKLSIWLTGGGATGSGSQPIKGVIYSDGGTDPDALLGVTQEVLVPFTAPTAVVDFLFTTPVVLTPADYFLGFIADTPQAARFRNDNSGARRYSADTYSDGPRNPWAVEGGDAHEIHVYATYTVIDWPLIGVLS